MTTEDCETMISFFKIAGKLPKDFEIAEITLHRNTQEVNLVLGYARRESRPEDTGEEPENNVYLWRDSMGRLEFYLYDWKNDYGETEAVKWNEATGRPEFVVLLHPFIRDRGLDIVP